MNILGYIWQKLNKTPSVLRLPEGAGISRFSFSDQTLATNETIFSAISYLSNAIAAAPITLRKNYEKDLRHPVAQLLRRPNAFQTLFSFIQLMETLRNRYGAAYAIKEYDRLGNTVALYAIDPSLVEPIMTENHELYFAIATNEGTKYFHSEHVIFLHHITTDGYTPISPVDILRNTIDYDKKIKELSIDQIENGLVGRLAISVSGDMDLDKLEEYNKIIKVFKKSGILYLDNGKTAKELNMQSLIDPKIFEVEQITIERVARVYNTPPSKLCLKADKAASTEDENLRVLVDTILPIARQYEQEFTAKLLTLNEQLAGYEIKLNLNGYARANMQQRGEYYFKALRTGWLAIDDVRMLEDLKPFNTKWSNEPLISRDLIPLSQIENLISSERR